MKVIEKIGLFVAKVKAVYNLKVKLGNVIFAIFCIIGWFLYFSRLL